MKHVKIILLVVLYCAAGIVSSTYSGEESNSLSIKPELIAQQRVAKETSIYMTPEDAQKEMQGQKHGMVLIDIRSPSQYSKIHITGSLNIPAHFIKTKAFLDGKVIVLIDSGKNTQFLERQCRELINDGFNAFILDGGIAGLAKNEGPLPLQSFGPVDFSAMTPETFYKEKNYDHYLIIDTSKTRSDLSKEVIPYAVHIPLPSKNASDKKKVMEHIKANTVVIALNTDGTAYQSLKKQFETWQVKPVYYLEGGAQAYAEYLKNVTRSLRPESERRVTGPGCASCQKNK